VKGDGPFSADELNAVLEIFAKIENEVVEFRLVEEIPLDASELDVNVVTELKIEPSVAVSIEDILVELLNGSVDIVVDANVEEIVVLVEFKNGVITAGREGDEKTDEEDEELPPEDIEDSTVFVLSEDVEVEGH
jgi:hypothetical protein